jgi:regulator of replication initiation timing
MYIPRHNLKKDAKQMNEMTKKVTNVRDKVQYTVNVNESLGLEYMHIKY